MPKGKRNKDPGARSDRKFYEQQKRARERSENPLLARQFEPGRTYTIRDASGFLKYYGAGKGGNLVRVASPQQQAQRAK